MAKSYKEPIMEGDDVSDESPSVVYAGGDSNVVKEAKKRKKGGKVVKAVKKDGMKAGGMKSAARLDRPCRKSGGKVGANERPLSTAHAITNRPGGVVEGAHD
jgi:hypothetical protein